MSAKIEAVRAAILAPSQGGKSFMASGFTIGQWRFHRRRSIVFDPWCRKKRKPWSEITNWGPGAWVTDDFARWLNAVNKVEDCCVVWDEATTNGGSDKKNVGIFTEIRHNHPVLLCLGHRFPAVHPTMRNSLTHLWHGKAMKKDAVHVCEEVGDEGLMITVDLGQYEFALKRPWKDVERVRYRPDQIKNGLDF